VTDDIVTRLRVIHCAADDLTPCGECLPCRAADEIERLRAEVERLTHIKSVNLYEESLALTETDIAKWDDLREGGAW